MLLTPNNRNIILEYLENFYNEIKKKKQCIINKFEIHVQYISYFPRLNKKLSKKDLQKTLNYKIDIKNLDKDINKYQLPFTLRNVDLHRIIKNDYNYILESYTMIIKKLEECLGGMAKIRYST